MKARIIERLQQIIQRACVKRAQRILVIGRHEHNDGQRLIGLQDLEDFKSAALRHLNIEKNQVRPRRSNLRHGFGA